MRNPNFPSQLHRFVEIPSSGQPHNLIDTVPSNRDESVEAKWEQIQYYESKENHSLNSLASSTATNSSSSTTSTSSSTNNAKLKSRLQKLKKNGLKKLANFKLWSTTSRNSSGEPGQPAGPPVNPEVSHAPNGLSISKMRAAKSMQNLEQLTRDSFYNLKDISNNLKQKYSSRMELRQQSQMYNELWDDEDEDADEDFYHHHRYDY